MKRICLDVDGVLADNEDLQRPYAERDPYPHAVEFVKRLRADGHYIILQTARYMVRCDGDQVKAHAAGYLELREWCERHGIPYDEIYLGKVSADLYVDDRAFRCESRNGKQDWFNLLRWCSIP